MLPLTFLGARSRSNGRNSAGPAIFREAVQIWEAETVSSRSKASAMKGELTMLLNGTFLKGTALSFLAAMLISAAFTFKQWVDGPIAIRPFTVMEDASTAG